MRILCETTFFARERKYYLCRYYECSIVLPVARKRRSTMKGTNTLRLNEATVIEALQYWLDHVSMRQKVRVTSFRCPADAKDTYELTIESVAGAEGDQS
jgi:hypothetical protein